MCSPRRVITAAICLVGLLAVSVLFWSEVLDAPSAGAPLLFYAMLGGIIFYPTDLTGFLRDFMVFFWRLVLLVCLPGDEIHFMEVLVGDVLTSLVKVFQEVGFTIVFFFHTYYGVSPTTLSPDVVPMCLASIPFM
jgi:hypothetical protein